LLGPRRDIPEDTTPNIEDLDDDAPPNARASTPDDVDSSKERRPPDEDPATIALEEYLASRLQQIGEVPPERRELKGLKTGNGWDANQVI
jgi:hypothetical protein